MFDTQGSSPTRIYKLVRRDDTHTFAIRLLKTESSSTALLAFDAVPALPRDAELLSPPPSPNSRSGEARAGSSPERSRSLVVQHVPPCR